MIFEHVMRWLRRSPFVVDVLFPAYRSFRGRAEFRRWERAGRPAPPPHLLKIRRIATIARSDSAFVETGTYLGDMTGAVHRRFARSVTIELDPILHAHAVRRFGRCADVAVLQGDSGVILKQVLATLSTPAVFWLDAHYSAGNTARGQVDTPLLEELDQILRHPVAGHIVLVDDARHLGVEPGYPPLAAVKALAEKRWGGDAEVDVRDDIVMISRRA